MKQASDQRRRAVCRNKRNNRKFLFSEYARGPARRFPDVETILVSAVEPVSAFIDSALDLESAPERIFPWTGQDTVKCRRAARSNGCC